MNYIKEINAFEEWLENGYLTTLSQLLWYKLMYRFSRAGWPEWLSVDNLRMMADLRIESKNTFLRCRDSLVESGLIDFQKGKKGSPNRYRMIPFYPEYGSKNEPQMELKTAPKMELKTAPKVELQMGHIYKQKQKDLKSNPNGLPESPPKQPAESKYPAGSFEMRCVEKIISSVLELMPGARVPVTAEEKERWADEVERMQRLDHRSQEDIWAVLEYALCDPFWKSNVRSAAKFRKNFETLYIQRRSRKPSGGTATGKNRFHNYEGDQVDYDEMVWKMMRDGPAKQGTDGSKT